MLLDFYMEEIAFYIMVFREEGMVFLGFYQHSGDLDLEVWMGKVCNCSRLINDLQMQ